MPDPLARGAGCTVQVAPRAAMPWAPGWAAPYIGLPYLDRGRTHEGADCWGLLRLVYQEVAGVRLLGLEDAYTDQGDVEGILQAFAAHRAGWRELPKSEAARPGDALWLRVGRHPRHCGIVVEPGRSMLHNLDPVSDLGLGRARLTEIGAHVQRLDPEWTRRVLGVWRHEDVPAPPPGPFA